jgi:hypothetical protein
MESLRAARRTRDPLFGRAGNGSEDTIKLAA